MAQAGRELAYEYVALEKPSDSPVHYPRLDDLNGNGKNVADQCVDETAVVSVGLADKETVHFNDGRRHIDYVLAYTAIEKNTKRQEELTQRRKTYEEHLKRHGIEMELEDKQFSQDGKTYFLKLHAPFEVLVNWAEILNLRMPMKQNDLIDGDDTACCNPDGSLHCLLGPLQTSKDLAAHGKTYFTAPFRASRLNQFVMSSRDEFFSSAQRSLIVHEILSQTVMHNGKTRLNIKNLLASGTYSAAFPLHEEEVILTCLNLSETNDGEFKTNRPRQVLYMAWAQPKMFYKMQPLDAIRNYFGEKIGIYFAWLGFYTGMLVPAAIVGLIVFIYGVATFMSDITVSDICKSKNRTMCPMCDQRCDCWKLEDSCAYARVSYIFDNPATVLFAILMSFWATFFIEFWKRRQARLSYDWDVADFEEEEETVRPEYEAAVSTGKAKKNPVTQKDEPVLSFHSKIVRVLSSFVTVLFMICLVLAAVFGVIVYRMAITVELSSLKAQGLDKYTSIIRSITASALSLICIMLLNKFYERVAQFLTNLEMHRTNTQWEDSFTFKMFMFQCVNYYSSIFYIAFFKGRFSRSPMNYNRIFGMFREEECDPAGCLVELSIQLIIIMVGKQAFNNAKEILLPILIVFLKKFRAREKKETETDKYTRWERDYDLVPIPANGMLDEYLEMVIQFGFVTLFVCAFPLAPLFALLNNIIEIRLDAIKLVRQWRRPLALRAQDIGVWQWILGAIAKTAVLSNGFIIAFTSDFVNKMVYQVTETDTPLFYGAGLSGYIDWSLSAFNVSDFSKQTLPSDDAGLINFNNRCQAVCWYRDLRHGPDAGELKYELNMKYWHVLAAKLSFVIVFEHLVLLSTWLIAFIIPDVPDDVKFQVLREKHLIREAAIDAELQKIQNELPRTEATVTATSLPSSAGRASGVTIAEPTDSGKGVVRHKGGANVAGSVHSDF